MNSKMCLTFVLNACRFCSVFNLLSLNLHRSASFSRGIPNAYGVPHNLGNQLQGVARADSDYLQS